MEVATWQRMTTLLPHTAGPFETWKELFGKHSQGISFTFQVMDVHLFPKTIPQNDFPFLFLLTILWTTQNNIHNKATLKTQFLASLKTRNRFLTHRKKNPPLQQQPPIVRFVSRKPCKQVTEACTGVQSRPCNSNQLVSKSRTNRKKNPFLFLFPQCKQKMPAWFKTLPTKCQFSGAHTALPEMRNTACNGTAKENAFLCAENQLNLFNTTLEQYLC